MGCGASAGASAPKGPRAAGKVSSNPSAVIKALQLQFEGTDVWGFEKPSTARDFSIPGSDSLWSDNERTLAQSHGLEWLQKRRKVEQFLHAMQKYQVPVATVFACIQLFQEGAKTLATPSLTESLFVKYVMRMPSLFHQALTSFLKCAGMSAALQRYHFGFARCFSLVI
jgi:hypothetical protein